MGCCLEWSCPWSAVFWPWIPLISAWTMNTDILLLPDSIGNTSDKASWMVAKNEWMNCKLIIAHDNLGNKPNKFNLNLTYLEKPIRERYDLTYLAAHSSGCCSAASGQTWRHLFTLCPSFRPELSAMADLDATVKSTGSWERRRFLLLQPTNWKQHISKSNIRRLSYTNFNSFSE